MDQSFWVMDNQGRRRMSTSQPVQLGKFSGFLRYFTIILLNGDLKFESDHTCIFAWLVNLFLTRTVCQWPACSHQSSCQRNATSADLTRKGILIAQGGIITFFICELVQLMMVLFWSFLIDCLHVSLSRRMQCCQLSSSWIKLCGLGGQEYTRFWEFPFLSSGLEKFDLIDFFPIPFFCSKKQTKKNWHGIVVPHCTC